MFRCQHQLVTLCCSTGVMIRRMLLLIIQAVLNCRLGCHTRSHMICQASQDHLIDHRTAKLQSFSLHCHLESLPVAPFLCRYQTTCACCVIEGYGVLQAALEDFLDYYIFAGSSIDTSISLYREATGAAPLYPKWAFGFFQSKNHYKSQAELIAAAKGFRLRHLPMDVVVQDWHYWGTDDQWGPVWDPTHYPNPAALTSALHELSCRLMVSVWSKFSYPALLRILQERGLTLP